MPKTPFVTRALIAALAFSGGTVMYASDFRAGAGKSEVAITDGMLPLEGLTSQHDALTVRVLLMDDGSTRTAIVILEQPSVSPATVAAVKTSLSKVVNVTAHNSLVIGTHTTSAPHAGMVGMGGRSGPGGSGGAGDPGAGPSRGQDSDGNAFATALNDAADRAIAQANSSLRPVTVSVGVATTDININRDLPTPRGWAFGSNASGYSDKFVPVVRFNRADGKPLAVLMNAAARSVVMDGSIDAQGGKAITADLAGSIARYVEGWYGGNAVALFLMGAAVDQSPAFEANRYVLAPDGTQSQVDVHEQGFTLLSLLGERLGAEVIQAAETAQPVAKPTTAVERKTLQVPSQGRSAGGRPSNAPVLSYTYTAGPQVGFPVAFLRIGEIVIVGIQPELGSSIGAQIKKESPFAHTLVVSMVDGGAKYMVDAESYDRFTSEARGSQFARGAAAIAVKGIEEHLRQMKARASD